MDWRRLFRRRGTWHQNEAALNRHGRDIWAHQIHFELVRGSNRDAVAAANRFAAMQQVVSFQIKEMPLKGSERVDRELHPNSPGKWAVVLLYRQLLEANSLRPVGDSIHIEEYSGELPDALVQLVNRQIAGRETVDVQIMFETQLGKWVAYVSFPYSLRQERVL